jgi:hypothetical protein
MRKPAKWFSPGEGSSTNTDPRAAELRLKIHSDAPSHLSYIMPSIAAWPLKPLRTDSASRGLSIFPLMRRQSFFQFRSGFSFSLFFFIR